MLQREARKNGEPGLSKCVRGVLGRGTSSQRTELSRLSWRVLGLGFHRGFLILRTRPMLRWTSGSRSGPRMGVRRELWRYSSTSGAQLFQPLLWQTSTWLLLCILAIQGLGGDGIHPKVGTQLTVAAKECIVGGLNKTEDIEAWPGLINILNAALKDTGGYRLLGLFSTRYRWWSRIRFLLAASWESEFNHKVCWSGRGEAKR